MNAASEDTGPGGDAVRGDAARIGLNLLGVAVQVSGPAYHALLSRALGAGGYGLYTWSSSIVDGLALFVVCGMDLAVRRFVGEALARGRRDDVHVAAGSALRVIWIGGALLIAGMFFAAPALAAWQSKPGLVTPLRVLSVAPVLFHTGTVFINATQAAKVMRYGFWTRSVVQPVMLFSLLGLALYARPGTAAACGAIVTTAAVTAVVSGAFYHRMFSLGPTVRAALGRAASPEVLRFASPLVLAGVFWMVLARLDVLVFGLRASAVEVGVYGGCLLFSTSVPQMKGAFETVVASSIPHALAVGDLDGLRREIRRHTRWAAVLIVPVFVLFGGFSDVVLRVLGPEFVRGAGALTILVAGQLVSALCLSAWVVALSGRAAWSAATAAVFVLVDVLLLRALIPRYGMNGAALSTALVVAGSQLALSFQAYRIAGVQPFTRGVWSALLAGAASIVAGRAVMSSWDVALPLRFTVGSAASGVVYLLCLVLLGLEAEELALLRRARQIACSTLGRRRS